MQLAVGRRPQPSDSTGKEGQQRTQRIAALGIEMVGDTVDLQHERGADHHFGGAELQPRLLIDPDERKGRLVQDELPPSIGELSDHAAFDHDPMIALLFPYRTSPVDGRSGKRDASSECSGHNIPTSCAVNPASSSAVER